MDRWRNRVAVVTGASEGIGEAIVRRLAAEGMKVVGLARREHMLKETEKELTEKKLYMRSHTCDVTNDDQVQAAFKWIEDNVGPVSILVNNAAVFKFSPITDLEIGSIRTVIDTNLNGLLETTMYGFKSMKKNGIEDGHIININSVLGHRVTATATSLYSATKHGVTVLSEALKKEFGEKKLNIRVTSVSPGLVKTSMAQGFMAENPGVPYLESKDVVESVIFALSAPANVNACEPPDCIRVLAGGAILDLLLREDLLKRNYKTEGTAGLRDIIRVRIAEDTTKWKKVIREETRVEEWMETRTCSLAKYFPTVGARLEAKCQT